MLSKKTLLFVFLAGLFISPFVYNPNSAIPFEVPKVWFVRYWIEILVVLGIIFYNQKIGVKQDNPKKGDKSIATLVIAFAVVAVTTSLTGVDVTKSFAGNYFRNDGLFTFLHFVLLFFFLQVYLKKDWIEKSIKAIAASGVILSILSISIWVLINIFRKYGIETWVDDSIGLTFGNPNFLTGYLLLTLSLSPSISWIFIILAIFLTKAWIGLVGVIAFLAFKTRPLVFLGVIIVILLFSFFQKDLIRNQFDTLFANSAESRERIYAKGLLAYSKRPLLGYGWSNFDYAFASVDWPIHFENDVYVDKAHSSILEVMVATGLFGLVVYLAIIFKVIKKFSQNKFMLLGFVLLVLHMQTNVISISEELIFWLYISIAAKT